MRLLKDLHLYPTIGFNEIKFYDSYDYVRSLIGDPYCIMRSQEDSSFYKGVFNDGNLILSFHRELHHLTRIQYNLNHNSMTRLYLDTDAVSPYIYNVLEWVILHDQDTVKLGEESYHSDKLHMDLFHVSNHIRHLSLIELFP